MDSILSHMQTAYYMSLLEIYNYILSSAISKVLFERNPLGELFINPQRPQKDADDWITLWKISLGSNDVFVKALPNLFLTISIKILG